MARSTFLARLCKGLSAIGLICAATTALAQAPAQDAPKNLQVLPKDWTRPQVVAVMQNINAALGVGCDHCHVVPQGAPPDFASDDKPEKKFARAMMKMTQGINTTLKTDLTPIRQQSFDVTCYTCHHGNRLPETLEHALTTELAKEGVDSTVALYRSLRADFYGRAAYDFGEWSLVSVAENLSRDPAQAGAAIALLNENLVHYPESAGTYARLGETYLVKGDTTTAMTQFDKATALAPDDPWLKRRVERLKGKK